MRTTPFRLLACLAFLALVALPSAAALEAGGQPAAHKVLSNGLEVFVVENHAVPLVTICVAFRGGASAQTRDDAGLFHLYEHMMFDGNEKYPTQAAFMAALNRLGSPSWNGSTGDQYINYYITVPSDKVDQGVEFWSWAIRKPVFNQEKLEREKQVVINEIRGYHNDPDQIAENALVSRMFPTLPWRKNVDGPEANVQNATVEQLKAMQAAYYIPRNTALLIGGDVKPADAFAMAQKWFGNWNGTGAPSIGLPPQGPVPPGIKLVYPDQDFYDGVAEVRYDWRGPDVLRQTKDTYTSDVFLFLLSSPVGRFKRDLMDKGPGLYDPEYIGFNYPTSRDGGVYDFQTFLKLDDPSGGGSALDRSEKLRALLIDEFALIAKDPAAYFGAGELEKAKTKLIDQNLLSREVASSFVTDTLTFWWSVATTDYFFGYENNCRNVTYADIADLIRRYILGSSPGQAPAVATELRLQSDAFAAEPGAVDQAKSLGYATVTADNAFWWQQQ